MKINFDGGADQHVSGGGAGVVTRDGGRKFIAARSVPINGITNPLVLEAMAARESLKICFGIGFSRYRD